MTDKLCKFEKHYTGPSLYTCKSEDHCTSQFNYADLKFCSVRLSEQYILEQAEQRGKKALDDLLGDDEEIFAGP